MDGFPALLAGVCSGSFLGDFVNRSNSGMMYSVCHAYDTRVCLNIDLQICQKNQGRNTVRPCEDYLCRAGFLLAFDLAG